MVGNGTPASCTESALVQALAGGSSVTFNCGPALATIAITGPILINGSTTIDGGNLITLDGGSTNRIFLVNNGIGVNLRNISLVNGNAVNSSGGAILNTGTLEISHSTFSNNSATHHGGAIYNNLGGVLSATDSTFNGNNAFENGGAIGNDGSLVTVEASTFAVNSASLDGGAIFNGPTGALAVINSTFSENSALNGGGIFNNNIGSMSVTNSTFSRNIANGVGGAIRSQATGTIVNSILDDSQENSNCDSGPTDGGHNLDSDGSCGFSSGTTDPKLDTLGLRNNGGPTPTIALQPTSPALGAGDVTTCQSTTENVDQTGQTRISGGDTTCDIGAFEGSIQSGPGITVNTADPNLNGACRTIYCPLRDAIDAANQFNAANSNPGVTVNLGSGETYSLTDVDNTTPQGANGLPVISSNITINGNGAIVDRDGTVTTAFRLFEVKSGGTLSLNQATVANGKAVSGGGLLNYGGTVNLNQVTFDNNIANGGGGLSPMRSPIGSAPSGGGAIYNVGIMSIRQSTFHLNSSPYGGAIDSGGPLNILASTFHLNNATFGGAIYNNGTFNLTNSTLTGNRAKNLGGALFNGAANATAINVTFSADRAKQGGEIAVGGGKVTIKNTIVANSAAGMNCYGTILNGANNLRWPSTDATCVGKYGNPKLQTLADNGGPTQTMAVMPSSPAIGGANKPACLGPPVNNLDQRGVARVAGTDTKCDIGAYEAK